LIPLTIIIDLEPNLFRIGPFLITWHGVFAVLGILAGARLGLWLLSKDGVDVSRGADGVAWMVLVGLIGARLLYVWENFKLFAGNLGRIFLITEGGISQWGGLFGAMVGAYIWARRAAFSYWKLIDAAGAAAMIGLAIGRIGDVINGEHHGTPTNLAWGVEYVNPDTLGQPGQIVHPEVAYEMILTLVLFGAILPFHQRLKAKLPDGVVGLTYLGLYGFGRFFLSYFRTDPAVLAGLRQAQLASLLMVALAVIAVAILMRQRRSIEPVEPEAPAPKPAAPEAPAAKPAEPEVREPEPAKPEVDEPHPSKPDLEEPEPSDPIPTHMNLGEQARSQRSPRVRRTQPRRKAAPTPPATGGDLPNSSGAATPET
jgi:phosphatidylglycerol:prolipoprotein diacylglycerol transferase